MRASCRNRGLVMDAYSELRTRIDRLCALASRPEADRALVDELNDALSEGYAHVLATEQQVVEVEEHIVDLVLEGDEARSRELAVLDAKRRGLTCRAQRLRDDLARMHDCFVTLSAR
jgi:hypothetical protein